MIHVSKGIKKTMTNTKRKFNPDLLYAGNYQPLDGTVEFYGRINSLLKKTDIVLNIDAGRGAWYFEDKCEYRRKLINIKPLVKKLIGADIDPIVLKNPTTSANYVIKNHTIPLRSNSIDIIICDYVLEHVKYPDSFYQEVDRLLKPDGYFFARTPHKFHYVSIIARLISNQFHARFLSILQPKRKSEDVFPIEYKMNTLACINKIFNSYINQSYLYSAEPAYYFGNRTIFKFFSFLHGILPKEIISNIFIFLQKPYFTSQAIAHSLLQRL